MSRRNSDKMLKTLFVNGLTYKIKQRDIEKIFRKFGRIKKVLIKNGYGFVEFEDSRDAEDAIYNLNGRDLLGEKVSVERARGTPRGSGQWRSGSSSAGFRSRSRPSSRNREFREKYGPPQRTRFRIYVVNLSSRVSWRDLKDYMRKAGEVTYADAHKQRPNEGIVEFASYRDMKNALSKLNGTKLDGRRIKLMKDRTGERSRSRSRSRSIRRCSKSRCSSSRCSSTSRSRSRSPRFRRFKEDKSKSRSPTFKRPPGCSKLRHRSPTPMFPKISNGPNQDSQPGPSNGRRSKGRLSRSRTRSKSPACSRSRSS